MASISNTSTLTGNTGSITQIEPNYSLLDPLSESSMSKRIEELQKEKWYNLKSDTKLLINIKNKNGECQTKSTTLEEIKQYILGEILKELKKKEEAY